MNGATSASVADLPLPAGTYLRLKPLLSPLLGLGWCVLLLPVIGVLYLLVKGTSRGPGFYSQVRLGRNGRRFTIYKLRSMVVDAEAATGPVWASRDDPRVTWVGAFLRRYHLDELPQIVNVVKGDMCLVGPRPERPEIAARLAEALPGYEERLRVKPGITGMAQIHLPADLNLESVRRKLSFDLAYLRQGSLMLDLRVMAATMLKVVPGCDRLPPRVARCARFLEESHRQWQQLAPPSSAPLASPMSGMPGRGSSRYRLAGIG